MSEYYTLLFILFAFIQDEVKGVLSSLICFLMIYFYQPFDDLMLSLGYGFFVRAMLFDAIFIVVSLFILGSRVGNTLFAVMCFSAIFNFVGYILPYGNMYSYFKDSYRFINVLMFEVLLYVSFTSTIVYPWLVEKFKKVKV